MGRQRSRGKRPFNSRGLEELLAESAAGIGVSGDSGSGKSNTMLAMFETLVRRRVGVTMIDPHGDLAAEAEHMCTALPRRYRDRLLIVRPSDLTKVVAINPLAVPGLKRGEWLHWRAHIASKVSQVARMLLYAWGEHNFNSKPVMFKWMTRALTTLATTGLTIPDARHFFHVQGDVYRALSEAAPDELARIEMSELRDMRPREREELIASAKNRFLGFLENPAVELALGRPAHWIDVRQLLRGGCITIISLERGGVLREEDVEIFANLWLTELLYAVFTQDRADRTPHVILLDELPVFSSSFDVLTRALAQVRKYLVRFVCAFQGAQVFPERTNDRLLNALVSHCRTTVVFRHRNPADAKFFSEIATLPALDPMKEKFRLTQLQQLQAGHDLIHLTDRSENWSDGSQSGGSQSEGTSSSAGESRSESRSSGGGESTTVMKGALHEAVTHAHNEQHGESAGRTINEGASRSEGTTWSTTAMHGTARTRRATLVPRIITREVVTSLQLLSMDEQVLLGAREIARLDVGEALVYTSGRAAVRVRFALARRPFERTPTFAQKQLRLLRRDVAAGPAFATPAQIIAERREFEQRLVAHLMQLCAAPSTGSLPPPERPGNPHLSI